MPVGIPDSRANSLIPIPRPWRKIAHFQNARSPSWSPMRWHSSSSTRSASVAVLGRYRYGAAGGRPTPTPQVPRGFGEPGGTESVRTRPRPSSRESRVDRRGPQGAFPIHDGRSLRMASSLRCRVIAPMSPQRAAGVAGWAGAPTAGGAALPARCSAARALCTWTIRGVNGSGSGLRSRAGSFAVTPISSSAGSLRSYLRYFSGWYSVVSGAVAPSSVFFVVATFGATFLSHGVTHNLTHFPDGIGGIGRT